MSNEKLINEYFDGNLDTSNQEYLFSELSKNEEMRYDFNQQFAIKLAVSRDTTAFVPRAETSEKLFKSLGFVGGTTNKKRALWGNYGKLFFTGLMTSLATVILMLWLFPSNGSSNSNNNVSIPTISNFETDRNLLVVEMPKETNEDKSQKTYTQPNDTSVKYEKLRSEINRLNSENSLLKNEISNINSANKFLAENNTKSKVIDKDDTKERNNIIRKPTNYSTVFESNFVNIPFDNNVGSQTNTYIIRNYNRIANESSVKLEAAIGRYFQNIGNEFIERNNTFSDNIRLTALYKLNREFAIGADFRQENFYQEFTATNNDGNEIFYQQQPTVYSGSLLFRYYPSYLNLYNIRPSFDLSIGAANIGELARFGIGIDYSFFDNTYFYLKSDYTFLSFYHKNLNFSSSKFGTHIGVGIEF